MLKYSSGFQTGGVERGKGRERGKAAKQHPGLHCFWERVYAYSQCCSPGDPGVAGRLTVPAKWFKKRERGHLISSQKPEVPFNPF